MYQAYYPRARDNHQLNILLWSLRKISFELLDLFSKKYDLQAIKNNDPNEKEKLSNSKPCF